MSLALALALASGAKSLALALNLKSLALDLKLAWPCWSLSRYCAKFYDAHLLPSTNILCTSFSVLHLTGGTVIVTCFLQSKKPKKVVIGAVRIRLCSVRRSERTPIDENTIGSVCRSIYSQGGVKKARKITAHRKRENNNFDV